MNESRCAFPALIQAMLLIVFPAVAAAQGACESARSQWAASFTALQESMASYNQVKTASFADRIRQEKASGGPALSIARIVRTALAERTSLMAEAGGRCREAARREDRAFEDWRRCAFTGSSRRGGPHSAEIDSAAAQRKRLLADLKDLLLEEAYAQYKNYQQPTPQEYSAYGPMYGPNRNAGYQPYQGYGGYR